jgi:hypothetical protein
MMRNWILPLVGATLFVAQAAMASNTVLGFSGLGCWEAVENFYNGGTGGQGSGPGPNYGISFTSNALALPSANTKLGQSCYSNIANTPSGSNGLFFLGKSAATMNDKSGFTTGFSFDYSAPYYSGFVDVWSGLNGTGTLLATLDLPTTAGCTQRPNYCVWNGIGVSFSGTAESVQFGGSQNYIVFDDITLGSSIPGTPTPEPATIALLGSGLIGAGVNLRCHRNRKP